MLGPAPVAACDGYTTGGGISSVDEEYAMIRRPRRAHSHSPRKIRRIAPSPSSRPRYSQRLMSPLARPTRSPPKRRLYENQWPTDFARVVLTSQEFIKRITVVSWFEIKEENFFFELYKTFLLILVVKSPSVCLRDLQKYPS